MKIAGSFLKVQDNKEKIKKLEQSTDQIHFDIMDGIFTQNKTPELESINIKKDIDIHLMVVNIKKYVEKVLKYNPKYITFHAEATDDIKECIKYIKEKNIKVGLAINPETQIETIYKYLNDIDLVLIMSVKPGKGGQKFIDISDKINKLYNYRKEKHLSFLIEVDGGINNKTIKKINNADIAVCGSFITDSNDYNEKVKALKNALGFTLSELLGVIILLSIISLIAFSAIDRNIRNGRVKTCKAQEKNIIEGAKMYVIDHPDQLPDVFTPTKNILISNLKIEKYIDNDLKNPMTDADYKNDTRVEIKYVNKQYTYTVKYGTQDKGC